MVEHKDLVSRCDVHEQEINDLKHIVYGKEGLDGRMIKICERVNLLLWISGLTFAAVITFLVTASMTHIFSK